MGLSSFLLALGWTAIGVYIWAKGEPVEAWRYAVLCFLLAYLDAMEFLS